MKNLSIDGIEHLERLMTFSTTEISDGQCGENVMDVGIKPLSSAMKMAGIALTVKLPFEESETTIDAVESAGEGDILIIDTSGTRSKAVWGDVKTLKALKNKIAGIVVDGAVRDKNRIIELGLPVFTRYVTPVAAGKGRTGHINIPVACGGVWVNPGDYIIGDENGVVVVRESAIEGVLKEAGKKLESDMEKIRLIEES